MYSGHAKPILQMMCLGDHLLSLGQDRRLLLWKLGSYDAPLVSSLPVPDMLANSLGSAVEEIYSKLGSYDAPLVSSLPATDMLAMLV